MCLCATETRLSRVNGLLIFFFVVFSSDGKDGETETKDEKGERVECFFRFRFRGLALTIASRVQLLKAELRSAATAGTCGSAVCPPPPERLI